MREDATGSQAMWGGCACIAAAAQKAIMEGTTLARVRPVRSSTLKRAGLSQSLKLLKLTGPGIHRLLCVEHVNENRKPVLYLVGMAHC